MKHICLIICLLFSLSGATGAQAAGKIQENLVWYRMHLGMGKGEHSLSIDKMRSFIDSTISPRFSQGLTITDSRGQWNSPGLGLIRERTAVVDIYCEDTEDNKTLIEDIAHKYIQRFEAANASSFILRMPGAASMMFYSQ